MSFNVLVTAPSIALAGLAVLEEAGCRVLYAGTPEEMKAVLAGGEIDAIISRILPISGAVMDLSPRLRVISRHGVGYNNVDVAAATARGIPVFITKATNAQSVVELTVGLLIAAARKIIDYDQLVQSGGWVRVGTGPTVAEILMPGICRRLLETMPGVQVELMVGLGDIVRTALREDRLDLIVSTILPTDNVEFEVDAVTQDKVVVAARADSELCQAPVEIEQLLGRKWILSSPTAASRQWLDWAFTLRNHPPPSVQIESNSVHALPALLAQSDLLGFVPLSYLQAGPAMTGLAEVRCSATTMPRQIGILRRRGGYLSPAAAHVYQGALHSELPLI